MYSLLIFDWDGTLIDSQSRIIACMQRAALEAGQPGLADEAVREIIGLGLPEAIRALIPGICDTDMETVRGHYVKHFLDEEQSSSPLYPGVETSLASLHDKGYRLAVATGKSRRGLDRVLEQTGLGELFETTRCADETRSKPHPQMLAEILDETGVDVSRALMIGDTEYDLNMAQNIGMDRAGVSYGAHAIERLLALDPVFRIDDFPELEQWLERQ